MKESKNTKAVKQQEPQQETVDKAKYLELAAAYQKAINKLQAINNVINL